jgi:heterogeneous nuclear ribonucleoprotein A1/A3
MQNKIFVGNLAFNTTAQNLQEAFEKFGEISEIKVPTDRDSGRVRGFAFITFEKQQDAESALSMDSKELNGRAIRVSIATEKKDSGSSRGGYGGSGDRRRNY